MKIRMLATAVAAAALTTGVLTTGVLATGTVAASAAPAAPSPAADSADDCRFGQRLLSTWLRLPADLRGDLQSLRSLDPADRRDAADGIRDAAVAGEYGPRVQAGAERLRDRRIDVITRLPAELKDDLVELAHAAPEDRRELAQTIADVALDGGYGARPQAVAERIRASDAWQECVAGDGD